jgi:hypothetical protein
MGPGRGCREASTRGLISEAILTESLEGERKRLEPEAGEEFMRRSSLQFFYCKNVL